MLINPQREESRKQEDYSSTIATVAMWSIVLVTTVALNVLALQGRLSFSTAAYANVGVGGFLSIYSLVKAIKVMGKDTKACVLYSIFAVAALALAASALFFAHLLPPKIGASLALGGILLPSALALLVLCVGCKKNSPDAVEKSSRSESTIGETGAKSTATTPASFPETPASFEE